MLDHVTIGITDIARSKDFYDRALRPLGLRPNYHPDYYGAFVLDRDGHDVEAVCRAPELRR